MNRILIIGATSAIANACAREWQRSGDCQFVLTGRNMDKLTAIQSDLRIRGASLVEILEFDINNINRHEEIITKSVGWLGQLDRILMAPGLLPNQQRCQEDSTYARDVLDINSTSTLLLLERLGTQLEQQRAGQLAVISSVAGDRGRMSNYYYGSTKAAVTTFCSGLMMRLQKAEVAVSIIKPGFVRTPMTAELELPEKLVATPTQVAKVIVKGIDKQREVIYAPGFWLLIMTIIRLVPTSIFKRLDL